MDHSVSNVTKDTEIRDQLLNLLMMTVFRTLQKPWRRVMAELDPGPHLTAPVSLNWLPTEPGLQGCHRLVMNP